MPPPIRVLLVSGSLRRRSTCTAALRTLALDAPDGVDTRLYGDLVLLPSFNPDDDVTALSGAAANLRQAIRDADAVLFATPEYAGSLPGAFKNLLDWSIGDAVPGSLHHKPVAWLNVSPRDALGAHQSLRAVLTYAGASIVEEACVQVPVTANDVDEQVLVVTPAVRHALGAALDNLVARIGPRSVRPVT